MESMAGMNNGLHARMSQVERDQNDHEKRIRAIEDNLAGIKWGIRALVVVLMPIATFVLGRLVE